MKWTKSGRVRYWHDDDLFSEEFCNRCRSQLGESMAIGFRRGGPIEGREALLDEQTVRAIRWHLLYAVEPPDNRSGPLMQVCFRAPPNAPASNPRRVYAEHLRSRGHTYRAIRYLMGMAHSTVVRWCKNVPVEVVQPHPYDFDQDEFDELFLEGFPYVATVGYQYHVQRSWLERKGGKLWLDNLANVLRTSRVRSPGQKRTGYTSWVAAETMADPNTDNIICWAVQTGLALRDLDPEGLELANDVWRRNADWALAHLTPSQTKYAEGGYRPDGANSEPLRSSRGDE